MINEEMYNELLLKNENLNNELLKRDNVIEYLLSVIDIIKHDANIKEQQLDYLLNHIKNNNYQEFSYKTSTKKQNDKNQNIQKKNSNQSIIKIKIHNLSLQKIQINSINEYLLEIIFSYLSIKDLIIVSETNKKFHKITSNNKIWSKIYFKAYNSLLLFKEDDTCEVIKSYINKKKKPKIQYYTSDNNFYKKNYIQMKKLNLSWEEYRPIVTTISIKIKICQKLCSYYGHCGPIWSFDRNDDLLFTGSYDKTIKIWNVKKGNCLNTTRAHNSWVSSIKFEKNFNKLISSSWDSTIKLWNLNLEDNTLNNDIVISNDPGNYIYCIESDLSNGRIISGNEKRTIDIWNIEKINEKENSLIGHLERINTLKMYNNLIFSGSEDKHGRIWDKRNGKCEILLNGHNRGITQIDYDEVSNRIFTSSIDKTIKIYDMRKNSEIRTLVGHSDSVYSITFDHGKLISGSKDNSIRVWNFLN